MEARLVPRLSCVGPGLRLRWTHCVISSAMTPYKGIALFPGSSELEPRTSLIPRPQLTSLVRLSVYSRVSSA